MRPHEVREAGAPGSSKMTWMVAAGLAVLLSDDLALAVHGGKHVARAQGISSATTRSATRRRSAMLRTRVSGFSGWPRDAHRALEALAKTAASSERSALLMTRAGVRSGAISSKTVLTASIWPSGSARSVDHVEHEVGEAHRVERGAERLDPARGRLRTKPTVSVTSTVFPARQGELAVPRVEGDEEAVLGRDAGVRSGTLSKRRLPALV